MDWLNGFFAFVFLGCLGFPLESSSQITTPATYLTLGSFNDSWGGGFTEIHDDLRSFGFYADGQFQLYGPRVTQITAEISGLTNRLATDSSRLDEFELRVRLPVYSLGSFHLDGLAGFYVIGDLGGQSLQNFAHRAAEVPEIVLPYSSPIQIHPMGGLRVWGDIDLSKSASSFQWFFIPDAQYAWSYDYMQQVRLAVGLGIRNKYGDQLQLNVGYQDQEVFSDPTREAVGNAERGFYVNYNMRFGLLNYGLTVYPTGGFSMGYLGVSLLNWNHREALEQVDAMAEFGSLFDANGFYLRYLWNPLTANRDHFQFDIHYQFWTLTTDKLPTYPARQGHYHQFSFGGNYSFIKPKPTWQILPYISARLGYKDEHTYAGELPGPNYNVWSLNAIGEAGIRIKLPANVIHKNCYYGLTVNYQYVATLYKSNDLQLVSTYPFAQNLGYAGLGGFVMIDL